MNRRSFLKRTAAVAGVASLRPFSISAEASPIFTSTISDPDSFEPSKDIVCIGLPVDELRWVDGMLSPFVFLGEPESREGRIIGFCLPMTLTREHLENPECWYGGRTPWRRSKRTRGCSITPFPDWVHYSDIYLPPGTTHGLAMRNSRVQWLRLECWLDWAEGCPRSLEVTGILDECRDVP